MSDVRPTIPKDSTGAPFERAMGVPVVFNGKIGSLAYRDIFDLTLFKQRTFVGISVFNTDATNSIDIAIGAAGCGAAQRCIRVQPNGFLTFDQQSFGVEFWDQYLQARASRVRALLSAASGTTASGTFNYDNSASPVQPADKTTVAVNANTYEFSNDMSASPGNIYVAIGVDADTSWTNLKNAINIADTEVTATINTATNIVTITSNLGGTDGNAQTISANAALITAGVVVSAANLASGANGLAIIAHIF